MHPQFRNPLTPTIVAVLMCASAACAAQTADNPAMPAAALPGTEHGESPALRQRLAGSIVTVHPVGGMVALDLPGLGLRTLRPPNQGLSAITSLSQPDAQGAVAFVTNSSFGERGFAVHLLAQGGESTLFSGPGDPLWNHAISPPALAPSGSMAFVTQPADRQTGFHLLASGPLQLWEPATRQVRALGVNAAGERPAWFPDSKRLLYTTAASDATQQEPSVRLLDTATGADGFFAPGHLPLVSSDGACAMVTQGRQFTLVLVEVATGQQKPITRRHGLGTPIALVGCRYLIYTGHTTPGAPQAMTQNNSNFVGPKQMLAVKVLDLHSGGFATLVPLVDPRSSVTALLQAAGASR